MLDEFNEAFGLTNDEYETASEDESGACVMLYGGVSEQSVIRFAEMGYSIRIMPYGAPVLLMYISKNPAASG